VAAVIVDVVPNRGVAGTEVVITGTGFGAAQGGSTVEFGGTEVATYPAWSDTSITCTAPAGSDGVDVIVKVGGDSNAGFFFYTSASFPVSVKQFTYQDSRQDSNPEDTTKADAADINSIYQEIEAVETRVDAHLAVGASEHPPAESVWTTGNTVTGFMSAADKTTLDNHLGAGGSSHATVTAARSGFFKASNKQILDNTAVYDSGWTAVSEATRIDETHNLNSGYVLITVYFRATATSDVYIMPWMMAGGSDQGVGPMINNNGVNAVIVWAGAAVDNTKSDGVAATFSTASSTPTIHTSGDYRIVVRRFV